MSRQFPQEVHDFIADNVVGRTARQLADLVNERFDLDFTASSIKAYKANHKLRSGTPSGRPVGAPSKAFPAEVGKFIRENYRGVGPTEMARRLNETFGTSYTKGQLKGFYANHGLNSGLTGYFKKGHVPPNKGKHFSYPGTEKTRFQAGHIPHNKLPIGTVLVKSDGYLWRKIGEGARDWRQEHILVWEAANGPIPEGCKITFRDRNRLNCALENLACITDSVNSILNRKNLRFEEPELTDTGIMIAKVMAAANSKKRKRKRKESNGTSI